MRLLPRASRPSSKWDQYARRYVAGRGPLDAKQLWCGEGPGPDEDVAGLPFVGLTGQLLLNCCRRIGLDMRGARIENVTRYIPLGDKGPTEADYERDLPDLIEVVQYVKPKFVLAMGKLAARAFIGNYLSKHGFPLEMDWINGLAFKHNEYGDWPMIVVPIYHPSSGFYDTTAGARFWTGLIQFRETVRLGVEMHKWHPGMPAQSAANVVGLDTESINNGRDTWCYSWAKGERSGVVYPDAEDLSVSGPAFIDARFKRLPAVLHNAPADWNNLIGMGVRLPTEVHDTMLMARVSQVEPGSLKALSRRYLGRARINYEDLISPHEAKLWRNYMIRAASCKGMKRPPKIKRVKQGRAPWELIQLEGAQSLATRVRALAKTAIGGSKSVRESWEKLHPLYSRRVEHEIGPPPVADLRAVPREEAEAYAIQDAVDTRDLYPIMRAKTQAIGAWGAYEVANGMNPMLAEMERGGLPVDKDRLSDLQAEMEAEIFKLDIKLKVIVGSRGFNGGSAQQVGQFLFGRLGIEAGKKTKGGADSTAVDVLESIRSRLIARQAENRLRKSEARALVFLATLAEYRHVTKLKSTNVDTIWQYIGKDGRVHPRLKTGTQSGGSTEGEQSNPLVSGRYSMEAPNLLAFPAHSKWAKKCRSIFVAGEGRSILVIDLDQIEMRTMAERSGAAEMIRVFQAGEDIHSRTARHIFSCPVGSERTNIPGLVGNEITYRDASKILGFLLLYGGTAYGFAQQIGRRGLVIDEERAEELRSSWLKLYDGVEQFWRDRHKRAYKLGYAATNGGWRRYLPLLYSPSERHRAEAQRQAVNHEVQGDAAEVLKRGGAALLPVVREFRQRGVYVQPMLCIHDEYDFEVESGAREEFERKAIEAMTGVVEWRVPLRAKAAAGADWGSAEK